MAKYWFRQKSFGYGATPTTWQGWALSIVACALLFGVVLMGPAIRDNSLRAVWMVLGSAAILIPTTFIAWRKTEGGWRWKNGRDD
jgi:hypothetical protein